MKTLHQTQYPKEFQLVGPNGVTVKRDDVTQYANVLKDTTLITPTNRTRGIFVHAEAQVL